MGGDVKRLGYLKQRILGGRVDDSGRQGATVISEDEEEVCGVWCMTADTMFKFKFKHGQGPNSFYQGKDD